MTKKFQVIVADCPWSFSDTLSMSDVARGAAANYQVMNNKDIEMLPIKDYADPDGCILALWVPSSLLQEGLSTMKSWGFDQKQTYIWVKVKKDPLEKVRSLISILTKEILTKNTSKQIKFAFSKAFDSFSMNDTLSFFMGRLFRQTHEIALIGTNSTQIYKKLKNKSQRSVSFGENLKHSAKPEHLQASIEIMFPDAEKLELFARRQRPNWTCLGNEVCNGEDIRDSLKNLPT